METINEENNTSKTVHKIQVETVEEENNNNNIGQVMIEQDTVGMDTTTFQSSSTAQRPDPHCANLTDSRESATREPKIHGCTTQWNSHRDSYIPTNATPICSDCNSMETRHQTATTRHQTAMTRNKIHVHSVEI